MDAFGEICGSIAKFAVGVFVIVAAVAVAGVGGCSYYAFLNRKPQPSPPLEYTDGPQPMTVEEFEQFQADLKKKLDAGEWRVEREWPGYPGKRYRWYLADGTATKWIMESATKPDKPPSHYPHVDPLPPGISEHNL